MKPGERLKKYRNVKGLTQKKLAETIDLKWYQIKDIEIGKVELSHIVAKLLYYEIGINPAWLLTGEGPMESPSEAEVSALYNNVKEISQVADKILQLLKDMTDDDQREILKHIKEKKLLKELLEEKRKREAGCDDL